MNIYASIGYTSFTKLIDNIPRCPHAYNIRIKGWAKTPGKENFLYAGWYLTSYTRPLMHLKILEFLITLGIEIEDYEARVPNCMEPIYFYLEPEKDYLADFEKIKGFFENIPCLGDKQRGKVRRKIQRDQNK